MKHPRFLSRDELEAFLETGQATVPTTKLYREVPRHSIDLSRVYRVRQDGTEDAEGEFLEVDLAFASEFPVERYFGTEILDVTPQAARVERVEQGVCPLLENHWSDATVGRVMSVSIGEDRVARARVRFSRSDAAAAVRQDVEDGIRQGVSFGYRVHRMELTETGDDGESWRVTDWELYEITIASMPADPTVGSHRSAAVDETVETTLVTTARRKEPEPMQVRALHVASRSEVMIDEERVDGVEFIRIAEPAPAPAPSATPTPTPEVRVTETQPATPDAETIRAEERERVTNLEEIGGNYGVDRERISEAVRSGQSVSAFLGELRIERAKEGKPLEAPTTELGMSERETSQFSVRKAVNLALERKLGERVDNCLELEASKTVAENLGRSARGVFVPWDVLSRSAWGPSAEEIAQRAATGYATPNTFGAGLVATDLMSQNFIEILRNASVLGRLGATVIPGLVGNVDFPKQLTDATVGWVGENAGSGDSNVQFGVVSMEPHTLRSRVDVTRRMLLQSTPAVENLLRQSITTAIAKGIDIAGLAGSGTGAEPEGILNASGVGAGTWVPTNGTTEYQSAIELETLVAAANADAGGLGYVTTPEMRGRLKGRFRDAGAGVPVWTGSRDAGELNGYPAQVTNALPKDLGAGSDHPIIAGHFPWLYIGEWGVLDLMPDETTLGDSGGLVLRGFQDADVALAHAAAFAVANENPAT